MKKYLAIIFVMLLVPALALAQVYTYSRVPGDSVTFAWDINNPITMCGTQTVTLTKGQTSFVCDGKTYQLVWTGEDVRIVKGKADGTDVVISLRYGYQAIKSGVTPESIVVQGETKANQIAIPLSFGEGLFKLKVRAVQTWDGKDSTSAFAYSDGPNAIVNGVARPWIVEVKAPPACTSFTYSEWTVCSGGTQTRTVLTSLPSGCVGGSPVITQTCLVEPPTVDAIKNLRIQ